LFIIVHNNYHKKFLIWLLLWWYIMDKDKKVCQSQKGKEGEGGTMSAAATNYVYKAVVKGSEKQVPQISKEKLEAFKAIVEQYKRKNNNQ